MTLFSHRPDQDTWKPVANASTPDDTDCYQFAADKIGVTIKIAYPVPSVAGASVCAGLGMKGIYILRAQSNREHELSDAYFEKKRQISE